MKRGEASKRGEPGRPARVAERIREEVSDLILRGALKDPSTRDLVVSHAWVSGDLRLCRVYLRLLRPDAGDRERKAAVAAMERAGGFLRREIGKRIRMRAVPELEFFWDEAVDDAIRVDALLDEIRREPADRYGEARAQVVRLIRAGGSFLVSCHRRPDADALGSALGLAAVLREVGKDVVVLVPEEVPAGVRFLPGAGAVAHDLPPGSRFDATFVTDTAARSLLPPRFPDRDVTGPVVIVDHHAAHDEYGDFIVRDVAAVATAEVVLALARDLGVVEVPPDAREPLYAALVADTGGFRYPGTSGDTLRLGASLVDQGVDPWRVAYELFEGWSLAKMHLLGEVLPTLETHHDGRLAVLRLTRAMLARTGATDEDVEGLVNYARMLRGVEIAALLWEQAGDGSPVTKVSLRSRGSADVSRVAVALGGGGHRGAAGAEVPADLEATLARVKDEASRALRG
jgi:phosphoesterase RecJ-like protein